MTLNYCWIQFSCWNRCKINWNDSSFYSKCWRNCSSDFGIPAYHESYSQMSYLASAPNISFWKIWTALKNWRIVQSLGLSSKWTLPSNTRCIRHTHPTMKHSSVAFVYCTTNTSPRCCYRDDCLRVPKNTVRSWNDLGIAESFMLLIWWNNGPKWQWTDLAGSWNVSCTGK